jgi:hypothetical protein
VATTRIYIPAETVMFDRTGGHLFRAAGDAAVDDARQEGDEYVYRLPSGRVYSVAGELVRVLPPAEEDEELLDEFCPGCYEHHGCCTCAG